MKEYLQAFLKDFDYPARDAAELSRTYDAILGSGEARAEWEALLSIYDADLHCDFPSMRERVAALAPTVRIHPYTLKLLFYICLSRRARIYYSERGLSDSLWREAMKDLKYKLEECREVWGMCGTFVAAWFDGFFTLDRFTLGRLQFEVVPFKRTYQKNGKTLTPESRVINVHIPRTGTPLDAASCDEAFSLAAAFFEKTLGDAPTAFVCHSWLLYPVNERLLPKRSNVRAFMERFDIIESSDYGDDHPDLWRLFDRPYTGDPDRLPYDSSFRRAYVDHIKAGGKTGEGFGVFFY
ncbi:MAG: DUF5596 domain-containing protein [Clostridia bacterium]|nr:DUF5596 domain-containing protein [Clostridia bacterium]